MRTWILVTLLLGACGISRGSMNAAPKRDSFIIMPNALYNADQGKLHPAVLERIIATEDGPYADYLDWALAMEQKVPERYPDWAREWVRDSKKDLAAIRQMAGPNATKAELLRALGRLLAPGFNAAFDASGAWAGSADVLWGVAVKSGDDQWEGIAFRTVCKFSRHVKAMMVQASCFGAESKAYAWDLRLVPSAFDPTAALSYEQVESRILNLHPVGGKTL